jgi:hypothetical protein
MATVTRSELSPETWRREIVEWQSSLRGKGPAQVLGVAPDADPTTVRAAFTALAKRFHPDAQRTSDPDLRDALQAIFIRVTEAYRQMQAQPAAQARPAARPRPADERPAEPQQMLTPARPQAKPTVADAPAPQRRAREPEPAPKPAQVPCPAPALTTGARRAAVAGALKSAAALVAEGDVAGAVRTLHEVLGLADEAEKARIRHLLARAYVSEPAWRRYGLSLIADILRESPEDAEALVILGALYHREDLLARAEATLRRALRADPGHPEARSHLRAVTLERERRSAVEERRPVERPGLVARLLSWAR